MHKDKLLKKYIMYIDKNNSFRTAKVVKIIGKTLTIQNAYKEKRRIHPNKINILGVLKKKKIGRLTMNEYLEPIEWDKHENTKVTWLLEDQVRICEYWLKKPIKTKIHLIRTEKEHQSGLV